MHKEKEIIYIPWFGNQEDAIYTHHLWSKGRVIQKNLRNISVETLKKFIEQHGEQGAFEKLQAEFPFLEIDIVPGDHYLWYKTAQQASITSIDAITTVEAYQQRRATMRAKYPHYSNIEKEQIQEQLTLITEYREKQVKDRSDIYAPEFQRYATADNIVRTWNTHGLLLPTQPSPELPWYGKAFTYIEPKHRDEVIDGYMAGKQWTWEKSE